ncbi:tetratricopeptide repeat protein [Flavobacteriaceae bacterium]|nr:tetratricopeptide repeat protein [Flavobacteriaceae bacterium]
MKKQLLMLALSGLTTLTYSQKNEVKALEKAVKSEKFNETNSLISSAEALIANADDKTKSKFYYLKVKAMLAGNDYEGIISSLAEFDANNTSKYKKEIEALKEQKTNLLVNSAIADQKQNLNVKSAEKLFTAYQLSGDLQYLYYASSGYVNAKDYKKALPMYIELKEKKYTGIKTQLLAYNKATKKDDVFQDKIMRSLALKSGTHLKPTERQTESALPNIVKNIALMYVDLGDTDNAIKAVKEARNENPKDLGLILTEANLYLKLNDKVKFKLLMEEAVKQDPSNPKLYFNLGVISAEQGDVVSAKKYYNKSLSLNPEDINSNYNMAALILDQETSLVEKMNSLGTSSADNRKYDVLQEERNVVYRDAKPYLENILKIDSKNENAARTLKGIYSVLGDTAKFKEMKALLESL